jgi:hypothetical protein
MANANVKITSLPFMSSAVLAPEDVFPIDDVSVLVTKKLTIANLIAYSGNVHAVNQNVNSVISGNTVLQAVRTNNATITSNYFANVGSSSYELYSFSKQYFGAELLITVRDHVTDAAQISKLLVTHNTHSAYITQYGILHTGTVELCNFTSSQNATVVSIYATAGSNDKTIAVTQNLLL